MLLQRLDRATVKPTAVACCSTAPIEVVEIAVAPSTVVVTPLCRAA